MKIVIVGAGAIGMVLGAYLSRAGNEVVFVEKDKGTVDALNEHGIGFMDLGAEHHSDISFVAATAVTDPGVIQDCEAIFLAVKSRDTRGAVASVSHLIGKKSPILSFQTGLGNFEKIERIDRRHNLIGGFTYMAGAAIGPGRVRLGGIGKTYLGELDGHASSRVSIIQQLLNTSNIETQVVDNIMSYLWCKVLVYAVINPVSALLKIKNGRLLEKMDAITLSKRLLDEGRRVAEANNIDLEGFDLYEMFFDTCTFTEQNISSMLLDLLNERETEIDALNGEIVRIGRELNVPVPTHETLVYLIKLSEKWHGGCDQLV